MISVKSTLDDVPIVPRRTQAAFGAVVLWVLAVAALSCRRAGPAVATVPVGAAYSDGFEVVVFDVVDGTAMNPRCVLLKDAEQALAGGGRALVPGDPAMVQPALSAGRSGGTQVVVTAKATGADRQQVRLELREGGRTYGYEYSVDGAKITPVGSEYRDLNGAKVVRYSGE